MNNQKEKKYLDKGRQTRVSMSLGGLGYKVTLVALGVYSNMYTAVYLGLGVRVIVWDGLVVSFYFTGHGKNF